MNSVKRISRSLTGPGSCRAALVGFFDRGVAFDDGPLVRFLLGVDAMSAPILARRLQPRLTAKLSARARRPAASGQAANTIVDVRAG
jgi:hypothetical protein